MHFCCPALWAKQHFLCFALAVGHSTKILSELPSQTRSSFLSLSRRCLMCNSAGQANSSSIPPSGHCLVFISKKWHLCLLCLHIRLCEIQLGFSSLSLLADLGWSAGLSNPRLPLSKWKIVVKQNWPHHGVLGCASVWPETESVAYFLPHFLPRGRFLILDENITFSPVMSLQDCHYGCL